MKRMQAEISFIPAQGFECCRVHGLRAYFYNGKEGAFFTFKDRLALEKWRNERSFENRKEGKIEDFQCCNDEGFFSFEKKLKLEKTFNREFKPLSLVEEIFLEQYKDKKKGINVRQF